MSARRSNERNQKGYRTLETIRNIEDLRELIALDRPIMLVFYADWCPPCRAIAPTIEKLAEEYGGRIEIRKVNIDGAADLAQLFAVRSVPTLFFLKSGVVHEGVAGPLPREEMASRLNRLLD